MKRWMGTCSVAAMLAVGCGGSTADEEPTTADHAETHHAEGAHGEGHHGEGEPGEGHHGEGEHHAEADAPQPARVLDDGSQLFGAELDAAQEPVALADVIADPSRFEGQVVKTEGEIAQVCQRMGCWMEIRTDADSPGVRVPMANHAFFLPRDVAGRRATLQGTVIVAALSDEDREHLESEGATATDRDVSIEATGVVVHPAAD